MIRKLGTTLMKFLGESINLFLGGYLGCEEEPNERFQERFTFPGLARAQFPEYLHETIPGRASRALRWFASTFPGLPGPT